MSPLTLILLAAAVLDQVDAQRAADRIRRVLYCAAAERRAQHRELERIQPMAPAEVKPVRDLSGEESAQLRQAQALDRLARATGKLVYDRAVGFYVPQHKEDCR
jgi:cell division protein FtsB